jgi:hypothetical protein
MIYFPVISDEMDSALSKGDESIEVAGGNEMLSISQEGDVVEEVVHDECQSPADESTDGELL